MYAAVLHEYGAPRFDRFDEPQPSGDAVVVNVTAVALSQFDVVHASGQHVIKPPVLPAVAGNEGMGGCKMDDAFTSLDLLRHMAQWPNGRWCVRRT
jgi:D-arabinose 1-dehydrogenase-like Zn-dependent alcohol dehydrogenase